MTTGSTVFALAEAARKRRRKRRAPANGPLASTERLLSPTQITGLRTEDQMCGHLQDHGLVVLERNLQCPLGELDIIARDGATLVFIEVRHRGSAAWGGALASVGLAKQRRIVRTARWFLPWLVRRHFGGKLPACRFDVLALEAGKLLWVQQAFTS